MSDAVHEKVVRVKTFLNNIFRKDLEIAADAMTPDSGAAGEDAVRGEMTFYYSPSDLGSRVLATTVSKPQQYIVLADVSMTISCDVPKKLWREFKNDAEFLARVYAELSEITAALVKELAHIVDQYEREALISVQLEHGHGLQEVVDKFEEMSAQTTDKFQNTAIAAVNSAFTKKAEVVGNYLRYKAKAGAKLTITIGAAAASLAALGSAATPAAPATIVPAVIGLAVAGASIGTQIAHLLQSAETVEREIAYQVGTLKLKYRTKPKGLRKASVLIAEFTEGFCEATTGDMTALFIPSMKYLLGRLDDHASKVDGLEVRLHAAGVLINMTFEGLTSAQTVLERANQALEDREHEKRTVLVGAREHDEAKANVREAEAALGAIGVQFYNQFDDIGERRKRVDWGRKRNKELGDIVRGIDKLLKTHGSNPFGPANLGGLLAQAALAGAAFASPPSLAREIATVTVATVSAAVEPVRGLTEAAWERLMKPRT